MNVFHGSYTAIHKVDLEKGEPNKDFGRGFYVTKIREQADYWARRMGRLHKTDAVVTEFLFYEMAFSSKRYKVLRFEGYTATWLDFIVLNRNPASPVPAHDYDIVEGPVADDRVALRIFDYIAGRLKREDFLAELTHHAPTHQICFCTVNSLQVLRRINEEDYLDIKSIVENLSSELIRDKSIAEPESIGLIYTSATFAQLSDLKTGLHKKTWQEVYELLKLELKLP
jgi:hypothetical protein